MRRAGLEAKRPRCRESQAPAVRDQRRRFKMRFYQFGGAALLLALGAGALAQDLAPDDKVLQGQTLFETQCASCHTVKPGVNGFGPSLAGVVGRPAGRAPGYTYSSAMANSG